MGRSVSSLIEDDRLPVAPLARPGVVSANGGPLGKRGEAPPSSAGSPKKSWQTGKADGRRTAGNEEFI